jgi:PAS domain S-box-containing protein
MQTTQRDVHSADRRGIAPALIRGVGDLAAGLLVMAGLLALLGRVEEFSRLAAPLSGWPRLRLVGAVAVLLLGLAAGAFHRRRTTAAVLISAIVTLAGLAAMLSRAGYFPLPDEGMALAPATMLTTGALGIFASALRPGRASETLYLGIAGFVLVGLTTTFLLARVAHVVDPMTDAAIAGAAVQVVAGSFLLGVAFLVRIWSPDLPESARWLPSAVGLAGLVTVFVMWQALMVQEETQLLNQTTQAATIQERILTRELAATARALQRAAGWKVNGADPRQLARDFDALRHDLPGLEGSFWLALDSAPPQIITSAIAVRALDAIWRDYLARSGGLPDSLAFLPLEPAARGFVIIAPGCGPGRCLGAIAGVMRTGSAFASLLGDSTRRFRYSISGDGILVEGSQTPPLGMRQWARSAPMVFGNVRLVLTAWPSEATLLEARSNLPNLFVLLGLVVSGLIAATIHLAQRARQSARESERNRMAGALDRSTDGIWEWDLVSGADVRSPGIWRYLGYDPHEMPPVHSGWGRLIHPDDLPRVEQAVTDHLAGMTPNFEAEYRVRSKEGTWHTVVDRGRVVDRAPTGEPLRLLGISADVTEVRQAEEAHEATERRFRAIFDSGFQFQLLLDSNGRVLEVNRVALAEGSTTVDTVLGLPVWETLWWGKDPSSHRRLREAIAAALGTSSAPTQYEEELQDGAAGSAILEIAIKPIMDTAGLATQLLLEARDITARRKAEITLQEVDTLTTMGRVAARVAHEINNPLAGIQNSFLLIKGAIPSSHPHFRYVGAIEREIGRIAAVTRQLYETYSPEPDQTGETSVRTVLGDAVAFMEQVNRGAGIRVDMRIGHLPTVVPFPSAILRQIAYNLVQNAIEASPQGATVHVSAEVVNNNLEIRVRDHGPGIPPEVRDRIFEPFFSTKDRRIGTAGMGLGLALVRRTVAAAGGAITVFEAEGGGSEFVITLPLVSREKGVDK